MARGPGTRGGGNPWDNDLVAGVAFHPRRCEPRSNEGAIRGGDPSGGWVDADIAASDGVRLAYRLYVAPRPEQDEPEASLCVLVYFHANAELCTDLEADRQSILDCGFHAILCPEFRGFAWSGGKPQLGKLCPDADDFVGALPEILRRAGLQAATVRVALHGRSLGSACATHVAAEASRRAGGGEAVEISALVVESGVMSVLELPMVQSLGSMMPQMLQVLAAAPCPLNTLAEMRQVTLPTLVIHGDLDEISPVSQAEKAFGACASEHKRLARYRGCHHNDVRARVPQKYYAELQRVAQIVSKELEPEAMLEGDDGGGGILAALFGALRCLPRRWAG